MQKKYNELREFLKSDKWTIRDEIVTPRDRGNKKPEDIKSYDQDGIINLPEAKEIDLINSSIKDLLNNRRSRRKYNKEYFNKQELSYLLWAVQGVTGDNVKLRTAPSGGAVHPFETYIYLNRVKDFKKGLYRYLPDRHSVIYLKSEEDAQTKIIKAANNQKFVGEAALVFFWTVIPKRGEWKYGDLAHKLAAMDAGHICQNLYLSVESLGAGMCAVDAYNQKEADKFLEVDTKDEFVIYMAPVGKIG